MPDEFKNAQDASERLISYAMKRQQNPNAIKDGSLWNEITHRQIARIMPRKFSDKKSLASVVIELEDADHLIENRQSGKSILYTINPRLLDMVAA